MPRLIDDLRAPMARWAKPQFIPEGEKEDEWMKITRAVRQMLVEPSLPVILIDNVAEYYYTSEQEYWDLSVDFPNLAPPYPMFWCEHKLLKKIHSKEKGDTDVGSLVPNGRAGMLINALDPEKCKGIGIPPGTKWILWAELWIDYGWRDCTAMGPHGSIFFCVDAEGKILETPWIQSLAGPRDVSLMKSLITWIHPALLAVSFLHCKNVTVIDNEVPKPLRKKYWKRHGLEPTRYKTLVIEPLKQILRHEGRSHEVGIQRALHICRGHFRDYREGRGLFGKYHQLVWTPSIVRGTKSGEAPPREMKIKV